MKRIYLIIMTVCFLLADAGHTYSRTLNLKAGQLKNLFKTYELNHERDLTLIGSINGSDLKVLRSQKEVDDHCYDLQGRPVSSDSHGVVIMQTPDGPRKVMRK